MFTLFELSGTNWSQTELGPATPYHLFNFDPGIVYTNTVAGGAETPRRIFFRDVDNAAFISCISLDDPNAIIMLPQSGISPPPSVHSNFEFSPLDAFSMVVDASANLYWYGNWGPNPPFRNRPTKTIIKAPLYNDLTQYSQNRTLFLDNYPPAPPPPLNSYGPMTLAFGPTRQFILFVDGSGLEHCDFVSTTRVNLPVVLDATADYQTVLCLTNGSGASARLELFYRNKGGQILHVWQQNASDGFSQGPEALIGCYTDGAIAGAVNSDGRLEIFFVGQDNNVYHAWQVNDTVNTGWSQPSCIYASESIMVTAACNPTTKQLEAYVLDKAGNLVYFTQSGGGWPATTIASNLSGAIYLTCLEAGSLVVSS